MKEVYIISAKRTPIGSFGGVLSSLSAMQLGSAAIKGALSMAEVDSKEVEEVFFGNVVSANLGQAPARQAALGAGIGQHVPCTTVNKVCSSGIKSVMFGAMSIMSGQTDLVVTGGMESMSNIPYYADRQRWGSKYGHVQLIDGLQKDGLTDVYHDTPMGLSADNTAAKYGISREAQDEYAIQSYKRSAEFTENGMLKDEIIPVHVPQRKGDPLVVVEDEEFKRVKFDKIPQLRPAFSKDGTVTAANASTINDGASAVILASKEKVQALGLKPVAKILSFADAAHEPEWFTTAPTKAAPLALKRAGMTINDIDFVEVNEAFAVVAMVFNQEMKVDPSKSNVFGGSCALGHPLGASGARILTTLNNVMHQRSGSTGLLAICNGGGGASSMVIERV
jgi:acetyl-CoA C-acetyltransferase